MESWRGNIGERPKVGKTETIGTKDGGKQVVYFTNKKTDNVGGRQGWANFGDVIKDAVPWAKEKWLKLSGPIYDAVKNNTKISPEDWANYKIFTLEQKTSFDKATEEALKSLDVLAVSGLEYPDQQLKINDVWVNATLSNMQIYADKKKIKLEEVRETLYKRWLVKQTPE
jgi:hypothetical protein